MNCPNSDGITPIYLAKLFSVQIRERDFNPWKDVVSIIESHGGERLLPVKDIENILIYNRLRGWIPKHFELNLRPDVRGFLFGLLSAFPDWQKMSFYRSPVTLEVKGLQIGYPTSTAILAQELLRELQITNPCFAFTVRVALAALEECLNTTKKGDFCMKKLTFLTKYDRLAEKHLISSPHISYKSYKFILSILPIKLYHIMRIWHHQVFQNFACLKKVFDMFRPHFVDDRRLARLIRQYEESVPAYLASNPNL